MRKDITPEKVFCGCLGVNDVFRGDPEFHDVNTPGCVSTLSRLQPEATPVQHDPVSNPNHYKRFKIEPIRFIMENDLPFWVGNIIKYVVRHDAKDGLQDLKKARRYIDMQIKRMEGNEDFWK